MRLWLRSPAMSASSPDLAGPLDRLITLPDGTPDLTLGWEAVKWGAKYLRQPNGPRAGQRFEYVPSQIRFLLWFYAVDTSGDWLFRRAVRRLAKGSGKSPFAAVMALTELCAPVRLKDFDPNAPGGCVGKPVAMPLVQIAATAESQTENTMRMVRAFAPKGSRVVRDHGMDPGLTIYHKAGNGKLHVLTSSSAAAEGGEATFIVGDEPEHWTANNGGLTFASTLADNLAKSGSRLLETCNAWPTDVESVAKQSWDSWVAQEEGRTRGQSKILYDARIAPPDTRLDDDASLTSALELVYGDCWWQTRNLAAIRERIWDPQAAEDDSRRKYLNRPTAARDSWVDPEDWSALTAPRVVAPGESIALFFDGSKSRDATALVGCCIEDGYVFTIGVWEPDPKHTTTDVVPVAEIDGAVIRTFETYDVVAFFADVQEWQGFVQVTWPERYGHQLQVWAAPSARQPAPIAWDMRGHSYEFAEAAEVCLEEIRGGQFKHDGNPVTSRHVGNARRYPVKGRISISKESPDSPRKVDAAVCVIGARMVRRIAIAAGPKKRRTGNAVFR